MHNKWLVLVKSYISVLLLVCTLLPTVVLATVETVRVNHDDDDAEELISSRVMYRDSTDLEFVYDSFAGGLQIVGMRFQGVNVPPGATINSAYIEFETDETTSGVTNLVISGEAIDDASRFGGGNGNISFRNKTTASVNWSPPAWNSVNQLHQTRDISPIINELVNRSGWSDGNDMVIIIEPGSNCSNNNCRRTAESHDGSPTEAPLLVIDYSVPVSGPVTHLAFEQAGWSGSGVTIEDYSGNGNEGMSVGGAMSTNDGYVCKAAVIPNNNSYNVIDGINSQQDVNNTMGNEGSIALWYKANDSWADGVDRTLFDASLGNKYFYLAKQTDTKLVFGLEDTSDKDFRLRTGSNNIQSATWVHITVTWDLSANRMEIYVNGNLSATSSITSNGRLGNMGAIIFGDNASKTYKIAPGSSARGSLDEIKLYDEVLSASEVTAIVGDSHPCDEPAGCAASFPDGISSHNGGTVNFGYQSQLLLSPDGILDAGNVLKNGGSSLLTCDYVDCSVNGASIPSLDPGAFPVFTSNKNISVNSNQTKTLGQQGNTDTYNNVSVAGTLNVSPNYTEYYIKNMSLQWRGIVNFKAGDYWIENLSVSSSTRINVVGGGTVRLFVKNAVTFGGGSLINSPSTNAAGSPEQLLVYGYSTVGLSWNTTLSGIIYSQSNVTLNSRSYVFGAITAGNTTLGSRAKVSYDASAISTIDLGALCNGTSCSLGSFAITQPTYGLACPNARAEINIKAMCADGTTVKADYAGTINLSSDENSQSDFFLSDSGGSVVNNVVLTGSENGEVDVYLFHKNENPELKVTAEDAVIGTISEASTGTDFRTSGFVVSNPNSFMCGGASLFTITAKGQDVSDGGSCNTLTGFTGTKVLKAWSDVNIDPLAPGTKNTGLPENILLNGDPVGESDTSTRDIDADFSAGIATVSVEYLDVGEVMNVNFIHDDAPYDGSVTEFSELAGATGLFIVSPDSVQIVADDSAALCSPASATTCSKFKKANLPFSVTARAVCLAPSNRTAQSYRGVVALDHELVLPLPGDRGLLDVKTIEFDGASSVAGEEQESNQKISEVGVFSIKTMPPRYFGELVSTFDSENIGRFYPHHFEVSIGAGEFENACSTSPLSPFTYMDQSFYFKTAPSITIDAQNADNVTTKNYEGSFWKLGTGLEQTSTCSGGSGTIKGFCYEDVATESGTAGFISPILAENYPSTLNAQGKITFDLHTSVLGSNDFIYSRPALGLVAPFDADVNLDIELIDDDEVEGRESYEHIGFSGDTDPSGSDQNINNDKFLRYGRWILENAFGPETEDLKIPMSAQYYDGTSFVTNTDDSCSSYADTNMEVNPKLKSSGTTTPSGSGTADTGLAPLADQIELSAPGIGHEGTAELCLTVEEWLKFDWNGDGLDLTQACNINGSPSNQNDNPMSTATFGRYRGHDRIIYWREVSN